MADGRRRDRAAARACRAGTGGGHSGSGRGGAWRRRVAITLALGLLGCLVRQSWRRRRYPRAPVHDHGIVRIDRLSAPAATTPDSRLDAIAGTASARSDRLEGAVGGSGWWRLQPQTAPGRRLLLVFHPYSARLTVRSPPDYRVAAAERVRPRPGCALFATRAGVSVYRQRPDLRRRRRRALSVAGRGARHRQPRRVRPQPFARAVHRHRRADRRVPGGAGVLADPARSRLPVVRRLHGDAAAVRAVRLRRGVCVAGVAAAGAASARRACGSWRRCRRRGRVFPARLRRTAQPRAAPERRALLWTGAYLPLAAARDPGVAVAGAEGLVPQRRQPVAAAGQRAGDRVPVRRLAARWATCRDDAAGVVPAGAGIDRARPAVELGFGVAAVAGIRTAAGAGVRRGGADAGHGRPHAGLPPRTRSRPGRRRTRFADRHLQPRRDRAPAGLGDPRRARGSTGSCR